MIQDDLLVERVARRLFLWDGDGGQKWGEHSDQFRDVFRSEVRMTLAALELETAETSRGRQGTAA